MMGWDELGDWITWGLVIFLALVAVAVLINVVCQAMYAFGRSLRGGTKTPALSLEEVLERIPDVPYQELPGGAGGAAADDDDRETCVICVAPYEPGETFGVLPGCRHVFHKLCVAKWLRQNSTCPLCRAAFTVTDDARQANAVSAVENMV
ncbi:probable E3 ubiquitin-protein ligase ATL44 [Miscanthus floridulus]|uniref:probable E3 ubiquitin-protein ligase ATL44 n=1 Tax=Miscanthus floridulus TaxID=154761 RepID=UPI0034574F92